MAFRTENELSATTLKLFDKFSAAFSYRWTSTISDPKNLISALAVWSKCISDLSDEQIDIAFKKCVSCDEFISIASFRKAAFGIVSPERAYRLKDGDALANMAFERIDSWFKKTASEKEVKAAFIEEYQNLAEEILTRYDEY